MDIAEAVEIVRTQHHAVLSTIRADGSPAMSPVAVAADDDGTLLVSTRATAYKVRHLRRDDRLWLCVLPDAFFGKWIQVAGAAEIVSLPDAMPGLERYYRLVAGEHEDWEEYRAAMRQERRVLLRITPTSAGPDRSG